MTLHKTEECNPFALAMIQHQSSVGTKRPCHTCIDVARIAIDSLNPGTRSRMLRDPAGTAFASPNSGTRSGCHGILLAQPSFPYTQVPGQDRKYSFKLRRCSWAGKDRCRLPIFCDVGILSSSARMRPRYGRGAGVERLLVTRHLLSSFTEIGRGFVSAAFWACCYPCAGYVNRMMVMMMTICVTVVGTVFLGCRGAEAAGLRLGCVGAGFWAVVAWCSPNPWWGSGTGHVLMGDVMKYGSTVKVQSKVSNG